MVSALLDLDRLSNDFGPGLSSAGGAYIAEAAAVCLDSRGHASGIQLPTQGHFQRAYLLRFGPVTDQERRTHADLEVATENGAYALSILIIESCTGLSVVERSRKGTGFDYWLGHGNGSDMPFVDKARLEVSGIREGGPQDIDRRVSAKLRQVSPSDGRLSAYIVVVEFSAPVAKVAKK